MKEEILLFETTHWKVLLSENQYYLGRCFVIFKGNAEHLSQLNTEEFLEVKHIIDKLEHSLTKSFGTTHYNWTCLMNDFYKPKNKDKKKELHLHLWPRYEHTVDFEGEKFIDEVFGHHYDKTKEKSVSETLLCTIKKKILSNLPQLISKNTVNT